MEVFDQSTGIREVTLTFADAVDPLLAVPPTQRTFGGEPTLEKGHVRMRIGERPIVRNLKQLYKKMNKALPADLEVFTAYNIWLIAFGVGIIRDSGMREVEQFGLAVTFPDEPRTTIVDVLPQTRFVKTAGGQLKVEAGLSLNGSARLPEAVTQAISQTDVLSADAALKLSTEANVVGTLSFSVLTPVITAIGVGGRHAEWAFEKSEEPLIGDQHMVLTLLAGKPVEELPITTRLSATVSVFNMLPCKLQTEFGMVIPLD
jgi:hypothetical protein